MYHRYFGLREEPFSVSPDHRFFFETEQHCEAVASLYYAILQRRGLALLSGRPGLGKTSILFTLMHFLKGKAQVGYVSNHYYNRNTVLEAVLDALDLDSAGPAAAAHRRFHQHLLKMHGNGKTCVIIFDEAQDLDRDTLEAIRMLSNFETPAGKLVQIILAGQPRLPETLKQRDCEQIRQRLTVAVLLQPLSRAEVSGYMSHRLGIAGSSAALFDEEAVEVIASASSGVPRDVNTICFNSLTLAYAVNKRHVGREEVLEVLNDLAPIREVGERSNRSPTFERQRF